MADEPATQKGRALALTFFLTVLASRITRIAGSLLVGQKLDQLLGFFALLGFGGSLGLFRFAALAPFLFQAGAFNRLGGLALFLGAGGQ
ncbi:MAG TPA: hypothetical protein VHZ32_02030, partial [Rhizomicrobium sp.]|nr:hypothetical protein [Rhizomicrobium sp.]